MDFIKKTQEATDRISKYIRTTPLEYSPFLSKISKNNVYLKLENFQLTNSFKIRGALNKILSLTSEERKTGLITSSSGNHGAAFAYASEKFEISGTIYLPNYASEAKISALKNYNVNIEFYGTDCVQTEKYARDISNERGMIYISPYNDLDIIAGQATIGQELEQQLKNIDIVFVPVGGGGLISGIAGYLKSINDKIQIIGCQPVNSAVMYHSLKKGKITEIESLDTLSDGTAGGIEESSVTFEFCKKYVDDFVLVSESEIKDAIQLILDKHHMIIEGAAALSIASYLKIYERFKAKNIILIVSGSKISLSKIQEMLC